MDTQPHDRMTRICDRLIEGFESDYEKLDEDKMIIFISDDHRSGIVIHGFEGDNPDEATGEAIGALFVHMQAMFAAVGKQLTSGPIQQSAPDLN